MKYFNILLLIIISTLICNLQSWGQITVNDNQTANSLAQSLVGSGVTILNPVLICPTVANGNFVVTGTSNLGIDTGIVLTTGRAKTQGSLRGVNGPFYNPVSNSNGAPGDAQLTTLAGQSTYDRCILSFDFIPTGDSISFDYVFGSAEYYSYSCTQYNDAFGFFISGPGITGTQNLAKIPNTNIPVTVNSTTGMGYGYYCTSMGPGSPFSQYFINNSWGTTVTYSGFTHVFKAKSPVIPCQTYHLKLAIADAGDSGFDSGVFLKAGSLKSNESTVNSITTNGANQPLEHCIRGCKPGKFKFNRPIAFAYPLTINYLIEGTAVNGYDYTTIPTSITIPAYQTEAILDINGLLIGNPTGPKTVKIKTISQTLCGNSGTIITDSATIYIYDSLFVNIPNPTSISCPGQSVTINAQTDPTLNYTWSPASAFTPPASMTPSVIPNPPSSNYTVTVTQPGAPATCPSVSRTFTATVAPIKNVAINGSFCQGGSFNFNGTILSTAGVYKDTLQTVYGCDSIITLTLINPPVPSGVQNSNICQGQSFVFNGVTYNNNVTLNQNIKDTVLTALGCDSVVSLVLTVNPIITTNLTKSICFGSSYNFNGTILTIAGNYLDTVQTAIGCDSMLNLTLTVNPIITTNLTKSICYGSSYNFNGTILTTAGTYLDTVQTAQGCDSMLNLTLTVNPIIITNLTKNICYGSTYNFNGTILNTAGNYVDTVQTALGCDSVINLNLNINPIITNTISQTICQGNSFNFNGLILNTSGTYHDTVQTALGCDSAITLNLIVSPYLTGILDTSICHNASLIFNGNTYTSNISLANNVKDTFQNAQGCDSIVSLKLQVLPTFQGTKDTITACWSYNFQGTNYSASTLIKDTTLYVHSGCDSAYNQTYIKIYPADTNTIIVDTSACYAVSYEGQIYNQSTTLYQTVTNQYGCDSIYKIIRIKILSQPVVHQNVELTACGELYFEGKNYYQSTILDSLFKNRYGCDSLQRTVNIKIGKEAEVRFNEVICEGESFELNGQSYYNTGIYIHNLSTAEGCDSIVSLVLNVKPKPSLSITAQDRDQYRLCIGDEIHLKGEGALSYLWKWGVAQSKSGQEVTVQIESHDNKIWMIGTNEFCSDSVSYDVSAEVCCAVLVPNAFSPNGDGINDQFGPVMDGQPYTFYFQIYNRYGQKVFHSYRLNNKWDGTFDGQQSDQGVYFYYLDMKCLDGTVIKKKGDVLLMR